MDTIQNAANYVTESAKSVLSEGSKEANKSVAKDSNVSTGTRLSAAKDAVSDKIDEHKADASATVHKEAAKH